MGFISRLKGAVEVLVHDTALVSEIEAAVGAEVKVAEAALIVEGPAGAIAAEVLGVAVAQGEAKVAAVAAVPIPAPVATILVEAPAGTLVSDAPTGYIAVPVTPVAS